MIRRSIFLFCGILTVSHTVQARDPWVWPFAATSIWNMPIGSGAEFKAANIEPAGHTSTDIQIILEMKESYPARQVLDSPTWGPGRCSGTTDLGFTLRVPDDWTVPDAGDSPYGNTPNSNYALRTVDGDSVFGGCRISRCIEGGPVYLPEWMKWPSNRNNTALTGDGLDGGGQGASRMSSLGGTIRLGELTGDAPIRHAIKINPFAAKYCHYSAAVPGYRWPAKAADAYAPEKYDPESFGRVSDPSLVMGTLLAIPPDVAEASLGLTTGPGSKLFFTLQNYGLYFTEDAAWDTWDIIVERDVEIEFEQAYGFTMKSSTWLADLNRLMQALQIVDNNTPGSMGGGGTPCQPLAPAFTTGTGGIFLPPAGTGNATAGALYRLDGTMVPAGSRAVTGLYVRLRTTGNAVPVLLLQ